MQDSMAAVSLLTLLFLTAIPITLGSQTDPSSGGPYQPTECCFKFTTRVLPPRVIVTYYKTSSQCTKPGIIFITKKGYLVCANPRDSWVQPYVGHLQK